MTTNKENFLKIENVTLENIKATIFHSYGSKNFRTAIIFKKDKNNVNNIISKEQLSYYFIKLMTINVNSLSEKVCNLVSQSTKYTNKVEYNKLLISDSEITKKTKNLIFLKTKLIYKGEDIIAFSNSIWEIN